MRWQWCYRQTHCKLPRNIVPQYRMVQLNASNTPLVAKGTAPRILRNHYLLWRLIPPSFDPYQHQQRQSTYTGIVLVNFGYLMSQSLANEGADLREKKRERNVFLFLTILLAPILSVAIVGTYGLLIWIYQLFTGPPTS